MIPADNVSEARNVVADEKIDLVISDISLPDGSGNELMKYLSTNFQLRGLAMTGYGMEADIERCYESGFVMHLTKPVNFRVLENAVKSILLH